MAQGNLSACLPVIFANEGGLSMAPSDKGNWTGGKVGSGELKGTKYGIAASAHPDLDIANLTPAMAANIYQNEYWMPAGCEALPAGLDLSHFDATVNSGRGNSAKWLAAAEATSGGVPATTEGYAKGDTSASVHAYAAARLHSYQSFKTWATFGKGWAARIARVEAASIKMALGSTAPAVIAETADTAATKAATATAAAHVGTGAAVVSIAEAVHAHPVAGGLAALASVAWTIFASFFASAASARATALRTAT